MTALQPLARNRARAEAAVWAARLHGPERSPELEAGFRAWLKADEEHAKAFEQLTNVWQLVGQVPVGSLPRRLAARAEPPRRAWMKYAAVAAACALLFVFFWDRDPRYTTEIGEQRLINLDDGTRVSLNSTTRLRVEYRNAVRRVVLERGEAFFEVAHAADRPFIVVAGANKVVATGTAFAVRIQPQKTSVTLVEGKVDVLTGGADTRPHNTTRRLSAGQRLVLTAKHHEEVDTPPIDEVIAWRRGEVVLDNISLTDAVAEINRYDRVELIIDDPQLAGLRVSGIFRTGDSTGFATAVAHMYGLELSRQDGEIHIKQ